MVNAILDGRKTQTRRVVKPQPSLNPCISKIFYGNHPFSPSCFKGTPAEGVVCGAERMAWVAWDWCGNAIGVEEADWLKCPYGQPGDRLWVKETFQENTPPSGWIYAAYDYLGVKWKPSIFMPRRASRILLEITAVRVERLQDISEEDSKAEGANQTAKMGDAFVTTRIGSAFDGSSFRDGYQWLWESINGPGSWGANPWVWVIEFKVIEGGKR